MVKQQGKDNFWTYQNNIFMKVNGLMTFHMDMESRLLDSCLNFRVSLIKELKKVKGFTINSINLNTKVTFQIIFLTVMEKCILPMVTLIVDNGKMGCFMDRELTPMLMKSPKNTKNTLVSLLKDKNMERGNILILKEEYLKVFGNLEKERVKEKYIIKIKLLNGTGTMINLLKE